MSWHVVSEVYQAKMGSPTRKAIAAKLADWANDDGGRIFPSVQRIAEETETSVRTVQYALRAFVEEKLLVQVREGGKGPGSTSEYRFDLNTLAALPRSREADGAKGATGAPLDEDGRVQPTTKRVQPTAKKGAPVAPDSSREPPNEPVDGGSARARVNPDDAIHSFLNGEAFARPEPVSPKPPPDGVTEEHFETFRQLGDTFGCRQGAIVANPLLRSTTDPLLANLVRTELAGFPVDIVTRVLSAALGAALAEQIQKQQDGSAGKGRAGIARLNNFLLTILRPKADAMMRAHAASEAKNRTERVVHQEVLAKRIRGVRTAGGRSRMNSDDVMDAAFGS